MHKTVSLSTLLVLTANFLFAASPSIISPNIFNDDLLKLECEMTELTQLEQLVLETNTTQSQLLKENNPMISCLSGDENIAASLFGGTAPQQERLMGIPGFLWGFCCSGFGVLLVYLSIDDPIAKKKEGVQSIIGCAVGTLLWAGLYLWLVLSLSYY